MFSGIVEANQSIVEVISKESLIQIRIGRPNHFNDISLGDSIAVNGICLTVEAMDEKWLQFAIGHETLQVTAWTEKDLKGLVCNLERSLAFGDRVHGHLMSGHVEETGQVLRVEDFGENRVIEISYPSSLANYIWKKGGLCIQGVSLTVNECDEKSFSVCLIPETLKRTNLNLLKKGDAVNLEADYFAKAMHHFWEKQNEHHN